MIHLGECLESFLENVDADVALDERDFERVETLVLFQSKEIVKVRFDLLSVEVPPRIWRMQTPTCILADVSAGAGLRVAVLVNKADDVHASNETADVEPSSERICVKERVKSSCDTVKGHVLEPIAVIHLFNELTSRLIAHVLRVEEVRQPRHSVELVHAAAVTNLGIQNGSDGHEVMDVLDPHVLVHEIVIHHGPDLWRQSCLHLFGEFEVPSFSVWDNGLLCQTGTVS